MRKRRISNYRPNKERVAKKDASLAGGVPRSEYPRPQFVRPDWLCLNGEWEYLADPMDRGLRERWQEAGPLPDFIVVPFAPQTELSCKNDKDIVAVVWYARDFTVPEAWRGQRVLLHFGAVDYRCTVWVNGEEAGHNEGGHVPFNFDVTAYLNTGKNRVCLRVEDTQDPGQPRGKQAINGRPEGIDYYCTTGIWQTVWLEPVPDVRIQDLRVTPVVGADPAADGVEVRLYLHAPATGWQLGVEVLDGDAVVAHSEDEAAGASARLYLRLPHGKRWTPDAPFLYRLRLRLSRDGERLDEVLSYFGLRSVALRGGQFLLNGEPVFLQMVLDQGYWPESGMTAPTDEALKYDIEVTKQMGFNGARKHQKVEDPRWLFWADTLGLLVWGEMANARAWAPRSEEPFLAEWERAVRRDYNHPCIITWVPLNESWGVPGLESNHPAQYAFVERVVARTRQLDPSRPVISNDGWEQAGVTDILGIHDYSATAKKFQRRYAQAIAGGPLPRSAGESGRAIFARDATYQGQPIMLTEVGGILFVPNLPKEQWDPLYQHYASCRDSDELLRKYRDIMAGLASLPFLAGFCYTQLTDIEQEINGLLTYDRQFKADPALFAAIHRELFGDALARFAAWRSKQ